jgi:hypothetical protein
MSKKKAEFYTLAQLSASKPYVTMHFYDHRERRMLSSVDLVLNLEYFDDGDIARFVSSR